MSKSNKKYSVRVFGMISSFFYTECLIERLFKDKKKADRFYSKLVKARTNRAVITLEEVGSEQYLHTSKVSANGVKRLASMKAACDAFNEQAFKDEPSKKSSNNAEEDEDSLSVPG